MSLLWVAALLDQGSVTAPGCVLNSHVVETDLAGLRKGVIITLLLLDSTEMSFPAVMTDCHILTHNRYVQLDIILKLTRTYGPSALQRSLRLRGDITDIMFRS